MPIAIGASSGWTIGLILGVVVVIVAAAIVITILPKVTEERSPRPWAWKPG